MKNFLNLDFPKSISYNKKTIGLIVVGLVILLIILIMFQVGGRKEQQVDNLNIAVTQAKPLPENNIKEITPKFIDELPGNYSDKPKPVLNQNYYNPSYKQDNNMEMDNETAGLPPIPSLEPLERDNGTQYNNQYNNMEEKLTPEAGKNSPIRFQKTGNPPRLQQLPQQSNNKLTSTMMDRINAFNPLQKEPSSQEQKKAFLKENSTKFYANSRLIPPLSRYEIKAGSIIPVTLITAINSDLPGKVIAQVRENVYDSISGRYLLIPQGAKAIGEYDSKIVYAQKRVLVKWQRLILPNGYSLDLENMPGVDKKGATGMEDKVNNHTGRLISGIILTSVLGAGAEMAQGMDYQDPSYGQLATKGLAKNLANTGTQITKKNLDIQPTIQIRQGHLFNLLVDKDFILQPYQD